MSADSFHSEFQSRFEELRSLLACPVCQSELRMDSDLRVGGQRVVCVGCGRSYPIVDGIPVLIPHE